MDCNQTRALLDAELDGELDLVRHLEIETHCSGCAECARLVAERRAQRVALSQSLPRFTAPPELIQRLRAALPVEKSPTPVAPAGRIAPLDHLLWRTVGIAASLALVGLAGFTWGDRSARQHLLIDTAVASHVRSPQADHLVDVASTDQHTVKPWFAGKLDFSPPVIDLAPEGFPLAGGRLEYFEGRPAAALVFRRRQHAINLFIQPVGATSLHGQTGSRDGYHLETWTRQGFNFVAIAEIPANDLAEFVAAFKARSL